MLCYKVFGLILSFVLGVAVVSCSEGPGLMTTVTPAIPPMEIANRAAETMLVVKSLHFTIEQSGALAYLPPDKLMAIKRAEGYFVQPDKLRAKVRLITGFTPITIHVIALGDEQYVADPITDRWGQMPPGWGRLDLAVLFDPQIGLRGLLRDGLVDLSVLGVEEIKGQQHYHLSGCADGKKVKAMTLGFIDGGDVELEVWIGTQDFHIRRLYIIESNSDPKNPTRWDFEFSNWGEPVEIEAPPISSNEMIPSTLNVKVKRLSPSIEGD